MFSDKFLDNSKKLAYIGVLLYVTDIIFFATGALPKSFGINSRMIFFAIAMGASIPLCLANFKSLIHNKYMWALAIFEVWSAISLVRGIGAGNNMAILKSDFMGFLNFFIMVPMILVFDTKEKVMKFLKYVSVLLIGFSCIAIVLTFFVQMPEKMKEVVYEFCNRYDICYVTVQTARSTRIFFHSVSRMNFMGAILCVLFTFYTKEQRKRILWLVGATLNIGAIFVSYTRSAYLAFAVSIIALAVIIFVLYKDYMKEMLRRSLVVVAFSMVLLIAISLLQQSNVFKVAINRCLFGVDNLEPTPGSTAKPNNEKITNEEAESNNLLIRSTRKNMAIKNIKKSPVIGNGYGVVNDPNEDLIEYFYLDSISKMGVIGLLMFLAPAAFVFVSLFKEKYGETQKLIMLSGVMGLFYVIIVSYFNPSLNSSIGLSIYSLAVALSIPWKNGDVDEKRA